MKQDELSRRELLGATAAIFSAACIGCQHEPDHARTEQVPTNRHLDRIESALTRMLARQNEDALVIFEEKSSRKFVQFTGSVGGGLLLDLPFQALDRTELERARNYFLEHGVRAEGYDIFDAPGGEVVGRQYSFQKDFGHDVRAAANVVSDVFRRVYQLSSDFDLGVTEN